MSSLRVLLSANELLWVKSAQDASSRATNCVEAVAVSVLLVRSFGLFIWLWSLSCSPYYFHWLSQQQVCCLLGPYLLLTNFLDYRCLAQPAAAHGRLCDCQCHMFLSNRQSQVQLWSISNSANRHRCPTSPPSRRRLLPGHPFFNTNQAQE